jgi:glycosyltransferase involved in cell wall biosynthesis
MLTYQWARRLAARGHEVRVLSLWPPGPRHGFPPEGYAVREATHYRAFVEDGVKVFQLAPHGGRLGKRLDVLPVVSLIRRDLAIALAGDCEVVHNICREYAAAATAIARHRGAALVLTPLPHPGQVFSGAAARDFAAYRRADGIVALTAHEKRWYESLGVSGGRVAVAGAGATIEAPADGAAFRSRHGIAGPIVLFVGRQERYRGYRALIEASDLVWRANPAAHFVFIGEKGFTSHFHDPLARRDERRILDLRVVHEEEKAAAYAACDVFCMPSTHEKSTPGRR